MLKTKKLMHMQSTNAYAVSMSLANHLQDMNRKLINKLGNNLS